MAVGDLGARNTERMLVEGHQERSPVGTREFGQHPDAIDCEADVWDGGPGWRLLIQRIRLYAALQRCPSINVTDH
jgi:hypothetical protein